MTTTSWWALVGAALLFGAIGGGWLASRLARMRYGNRLRRATDDLQQRHAAAVEQLRTVQSRSQAELETARSTFKRQLAAMAAEPRAELARSEERLKAAYAELDRLRKGSADTGSAELSDGFAATRPMREGM